MCSIWGLCDDSATAGTCLTKEDYSCDPDCGAFSWLVTESYYEEYVECVNGDIVRREFWYDYAAYHASRPLDGEPYERVSLDDFEATCKKTIEQNECSYNVSGTCNPDCPGYHKSHFGILEELSKYEERNQKELEALEHPGQVYNPIDNRWRWI
jgi:hypothetical protein